MVHFTVRESKRLSAEDKKYVQTLFKKLHSKQLSHWKPSWTTTDLKRLAKRWGHSTIGTKPVLIRRLKVPKGVSTKGKLGILMLKGKYLYRNAPYSMKKVAKLYRKLPALK